MKIPVGPSKELELAAGKWARWQDWSEHGNPAAGRAWALRLTGTDPVYKVDGDFLPVEKIDGDSHFDVSSLAVDDLVKVSGASHNRKYISYWIVRRVQETLLVERIAKYKAVARIEEEEKNLRGEVIDRVRNVDEDTLKQVHDLLTA